MKIFRLAAFLTAFVCVIEPFVISDANATQTLRLGILSSVANSRESSLVDQTVRVISSKLKANVDVSVLTDSQLKKAIENNEVDLFISSSTFFSAMERSGVRDLATAVSDRADDPNHGTSATVLTLASQEKINKLSDLANRRLFMNPSYGQEILYFLLGELSEGLEHRSQEQFKKGIIQRELPLDLQIQGLEEGRWDAVLLPSCLLETSSEHSPLKTLNLKVVDQKLHSDLRCLHSTKLYPNLTFATLPSVPAKLSRQLSIFLLSMPPTKDGMLWSTATDYAGVDRLLRTLDLDAHAQERKWTLKKVIKEYWVFLVMVVLMIAGLMAHSFFSERLVKRRTSELRASLSKQEELRQRALQSEQQLGKLQRLGAVSHMSSLFAHELRQPLNAIRCYAYSLGNLAKKGITRADPDKFHTGLSEIVEQAKRADQIIQKVRNYVKNKSGELQPVFLQEAINKAVQDFKAGHPECAFVIEGEEVTVLGDTLEIELIFSNLIKNSYEASENQQEPKVFIEWHRDKSNFIKVKVWDNGTELSEEKIAMFSEGLVSTKPDGLGLGLSIVKSFVERYGGALKCSQSLLGGLLVQFTLPLFQEEKCQS